MSLFCMLCLIIFEIFNPCLLFSADESVIDNLENKLKDYMRSYYLKIQTGTIPPKEDVLKQIKTLYVPHNKEINVFSIDNSDIVNCWLGDLLEEKDGRKIIWNKEIKFKSKAIGNLVISDFVDFSSNHKDAIEVGVRDNAIYYNLDAYELRAEGIWDFLLRRIIQNERGYTPLRSNRLRKKLYVRSWGKLFLECVDANKDMENAKKIFTDKAIERLKQNSLFHELGHIVTQEHLGINDEIGEEMIAFLTELRYGPLPYEALDMVISSAYHSDRDNYKTAGRKILSYFISYIENEQMKGNNNYEEIVIHDIKQVRSIDCLYKLTGGQIRDISQFIYEKFE